MAEFIPTKHFKKKSGTTNKGDAYEDLFTAFLASTLSTNDEIKDFHLSSNDANFGSFDDLVVKVEFQNCKSVDYAVQIKHKNRCSQISKNSLAAAQGNFSIQKYFKSYQELEKENNLQDNVNFILYTNGTFDLEQTTLTLEGRDILVEVYKHVLEPEENLLNTSEFNYVYKFKFQDKDGSVSQEFQDFSQRFFFFPNQKQYEDLKLFFLKDFEREYHSKEDFNSYLEYIGKWSEAEGRKACLDKNTVRQKIGEILLKPHTIMASGCSTHTNLEIIREISALVDIIILNRKPELDLHLFDPFLTNEDGKKIVENGLKFQILSKNVKDVSSLEIQEITLILWHMKKIPLIVELNQMNSEKIYRAMSLFERNERRFILCGKEIDKSRFSKFKIFENLSDLSHDTNAYKKLLQHYEILFQGRSSVPLDESFCGSIAVEDLVTFSKVIKIGEEKEDLPKPYIEQFLPRMTVTWDFINDLNIQSIPIVANFQDTLTPKITTKVISVEEFIQESELPQEKFVLVTKERCSKKLFKKIRLKLKKQCHLFEINSMNNLEWIRSRGSISEIRNYRQIGSYFKEEEVFGSSTQKINIISAKPGAGKTVMLKNFKNNVSSDYWVVHTNLCHITDYFVYHHQDCSFYEYLLSHQAKSFKYNPLTLRVRNVFEKKNKIVFLLDAFDELPFPVLNVAIDKITDLTKTGYVCWLTSREHLQTSLENRFNIFAFSIKELENEQQIMYIRSQLEDKHTTTEMKEIIEKITEVISFTKDVGFLGIPLRICILTELFLRNPEKYKELITRRFTVTDMIRHFVKEKFRFCYEDKGKLDSNVSFVRRILKGNRRYRIRQYEILAVKTFLPANVSKNFCEENFEDLKKNNDDFGIISKIHEKDNTAVFVHNVFGEYFVASWMSKNLHVVKSFSSFIFEENYKTIRLMFDLIMAENCPAHLAILYKDSQSLRQCREELTWKDKAGRNCLHLICSYGQRHPLLGSYEKEEGVWFLKECQKVDFTIENNELSKMICFLINENRNDPHNKDELFELTAMEYADQALSLLSLELIAHKYTFDLKFLKNFRDLCSVAYYCVRFNYYKLFQNLKEVFYVVDEDSGNNLLHLSVMIGRSHFLEKILANELYVKKINDTNHMNHYIVGPLATVYPFICYSNLTVTCKRSALHLAVIGGSNELVQELIKQGADVNFPDSNGNTALHLAITSKKFELASILLDMGADVNCRDSNNGNSALHWATVLNDFQLVRVILKREAHIYKNIHNESPLVIACLNNNIKILDLIIKKGKPQNFSFDYYKFDSLMRSLTCEKSYPEVIEYLLKNGTDVGRLKLTMKTNLWPLLPIILSNKVDEIHLLIKYGADLSSKCELGMNSLHYAVFYERIEIVKILLQNNFDVNEVEDQNLGTSLMIAVAYERKQIVKLLLDCDADVDVQDNKGRGALHWAAIKTDIEFLNLLLKKNANVGIKDHNGETPLHYAASFTNSRAVDLLLKHGAKMKKDKYGVTPKMILRNPHHFVSRMKKEPYKIPLPKIKFESTLDVTDPSKGLDMRLVGSVRFTDPNASKT